MRAVDVAIALESASTDRARDAAIRKAWNQGVDDFFTGVSMSMDASWSMPLDKVPAFDEEDDGFAGTLTFAEFSVIRSQLAAPGITGEDARTMVYDAAERANVTEWNQWYRRILLRTLHTNLPMERVVHVLKKLTA